MAPPGCAHLEPNPIRAIDPMSSGTPRCSLDGAGERPCRWTTAGDSRPFLSQTSKIEPGKAMSVRNNTRTLVSRQGTRRREEDEAMPADIARLWRRLAATLVAGLRHLWGYMLEMHRAREIPVSDVY